LYGFNKLQRMIQGNPDPGWRTRYNAHGTEEWARELGVLTDEARDAYAAAHEAAKQAGPPVSGEPGGPADVIGPPQERTQAVAAPPREPAKAASEPTESERPRRGRFI